MTRPSTLFSKVGRACLLLALGVSGPASAATDSATKADGAGQYRQWIVEMKASPRGPFAAIKWFCKDGRVLAAERLRLREQGRGLAARRMERPHEAAPRRRATRSPTLLAGLDAGEGGRGAGLSRTRMHSSSSSSFLIATDDGWIFRNAQFYRGAIQEEDEREAARNLLIAMAARPDWIGYRYPASCGRRPAAAARRRHRVGAEGAEHSGRDRRPRPALPAAAGEDPRHARRVRCGERARVRGEDGRSCAEASGRSAGRRDRPRLRAAAARPEVLEENAKAFAALPWLQQMLRDARDALAKDGGPEYRYLVTANLLASLRDALPEGGPARRAAARARPLAGGRGGELPRLDRAAHRGRQGHARPPTCCCSPPPSRPRTARA